MFQRLYYLGWRAIHLTLLNIERWLPPKGLWFGLRFRMESGSRHNAFQAEFVRKVFPDGDIRVLGGPFAGTRYISASFFGPVTPRWLGCYEEALHPVVNEIIAKRYGTIIDVGSAEGYYAVGFARALPEAEVFSFDTDVISRSQQKKLIALNGVKNLKLGSFCSHAFLQSRPFKGPVFLFVDIESWEWELLDPVKAPALLDMDILTEVHSGFGLDHQQMIDGLSKRFAATHEVIKIEDPPRDPAAYAALVGGRLSADELTEAVSEARAWQNCWLMFRKRNS
jgi:hypothetical protein